MSTTLNIGLKVPNDRHILESIDVFSVNCNCRFLQKEQAHKLKQAGNQIHYYTIKDPAFMESLRPLHINDIMTDWPSITSNKDGYLTIRYNLFIPIPITDVY